MDKELNDKSEEIDYESLPNSSTVIHLSAGAIAGIMEHTVVYPIDSVKVSEFHVCLCVVFWIF